MASEEPPDPALQGVGAPVEVMPDQVKAPRFVDSFPSHGDLFRQAPEVVVINFSSTLSRSSFILVTRDGVPVSVNRTGLDPSQLSLGAPITGDAEEGLYVVEYTACLAEGPCGQGRLAFGVDSKLAGYADLTGRSKVFVETHEVGFEPANIVVSKGTTVTWTNRGSAAHFVDSDPHPSHNVLPGLESKELRTGDSYSYTFTEAGEWGYHCSAHYSQGMAGHVVID